MGVPGLLGKINLNLKKRLSRISQASQKNFQTLKSSSAGGAAS
jgi:hypothetical protein